MAQSDAGLCLSSNRYRIWRMKKSFVFLVIFLTSFGLSGVSRASVSIVNSGSATVETNVTTSVSTGGNSAEGGSVSTGNAESGVSVENSVSSSAGSSTSSVEVNVSSQDGKSTFDITVDGERIEGEGSGARVEIKKKDGVTLEKEIEVTSLVKTEAELQSFVNTVTEADENIGEVVIATGTISIEYKQPARLFGVIPSALRPQVTVFVGTTSARHVKVKFPWYHVFFKKEVDLSDLESQIEARERLSVPADTHTVARIFETLSNILKTKHDTAKNSIGNIR